MRRAVIPVFPPSQVGKLTEQWGRAEAGTEIVGLRAERRLTEAVQLIS